MTYSALVAALALGLGSLSLPAYAVDGELADGQPVAAETAAVAPETEAAPEGEAPAVPLPPAAEVTAPAVEAPAADSSGAESPGAETPGTETSGAEAEPESAPVAGPPAVPSAEAPSETTALANPAPRAGVTVVNGVAPDRGVETGGTTVVITGECFTDADNVLFDLTPAASFTVDSDTQITATSPAGTGTVQVEVVGSFLCGTASLPNAFTYEAPAPVVDPPAVTGVTPDHGPEAGGTSVTLTGTDLADTTEVTFGGIAATGLTGVTDTSITVTTPAHVAGAVNVIVTTPHGTSGAASFTYDPAALPLPPTIAGLSPAAGPESGGTIVTIVGTNLADIQEVTVDGNAVASFTILSDTSITFTSPAHAPGSVIVRVRDSHSQSDASSFTFIAAPVIAVPAVTGLSPDRGPIAGGTSITVTGEHLDNVTSATIDGTAVTVTPVSDTELTLVTEPHAAGPVDVIVTDANGSSDPVSFTFFAPLAVTSILPATGLEAGGETVTLTGTCFTGVTGVEFGGVPATSFSVVSDTSLTAVVPVGTLGAVDVTVVGSAECGSQTLVGGFEYTEAPVVAVDPVLGDLTPNSGPATGGTVVTATGTGFTDATSVTFGGVPATGFTVVSDTEITVHTPAHVAGVVDVVVNGPVSPTAGTLPFAGAFAGAFAGVTPAASNAVSFTYTAVDGPGTDTGTGTDDGTDAGTDTGSDVGTTDGSAAGTAAATTQTAHKADTLATTGTGLGGLMGLLGAAMLALLGGRFLIARGRRGSVS